MRPRSGRANPETRLKSVVLPAPLGPISAVIEPRRTSSVAPSTALTPPKRLTTSSTSRMRSPAGAAAASVTEHHLLALAEDALRPERHEEDEHEPDDHEAQRRDLLGRQRQVQEPRRLQQDPQDD